MSQVTSYHFANTISQLADGSFSWTVIENGLTANDVYAQVSCTAQNKAGAVNCNSLLWTNFNFSSDLPEEAIIDGVEAETKIYESAAESLGDRTVYLRLNSAVISSNMSSATLWPSASGVIRTYGDSVSLWGAPLTRTTLIDSTFGLSLQVAGNATGYVDYFKIRIYYSLPEWHTAISKESSWNNVFDAKVAENGQIQPLAAGWIVVNGVWQKWWPPPS